MLTSPPAELSFFWSRQHVITVVNGEKDVVNSASRIRQDFGMNEPDGWTRCMFRTANPRLVVDEKNGLGSWSPTLSAEKSGKDGAQSICLF
jgi:hypothetical protein